MLTQDAEGMGLIDQQHCAVVALDGGDLRQRGAVAEHAIETLGADERPREWASSTSSTAPWSRLTAAISARGARSPSDEAFDDDQRLVAALA